MREGVRWLCDKQKMNRLLKWPGMAEQEIFELLYGAQ